MTTTQFTVVATTGWQPVADETQITIGSTANLVMKQYVIHFGNSGVDYFAFFSGENAPLSFALSETTLTVNGTVSYVQQIEKDATKENTYNVVGSKLMFNSAITGGFQLSHRYIVNAGYSDKPFGNTMLNVSAYDPSKVGYIAGSTFLSINNDDYEQFFKKSFIIKPLPALTSAITDTADTLYITAAISEFKTNQEIILNLTKHSKTFTIGGSTGITVEGFTATSANGDDNHLVINLTASNDVVHGRTIPVIKFVNGTDKASVNVNELAGFVEPVSVVQDIVYKFKAGANGSAGMVMIDTTNIGNITFDTTNKLTIPESSIEPVLTAPGDKQLFALNVEAAPALAEGIYLFSLVTIDNSTPTAPKLKPLTGALDTTHNFTSKDAVYIVRFKLGAEATSKFPASAQVVGRVVNNVDSTVSISIITRVPLELTHLGDNTKKQLVYIGIGDNTTALTTVDRVYALPIDENVLRSSDLKQAGVGQFPSAINNGEIITLNNSLVIEFSKGTEDMFKVYAPEDTDKKTNIFATNIGFPIISFNIYNSLDWSALGFELDGDGKPTTPPITTSSVNIVYNIDGGFIIKDYFSTEPIKIYNDRMLEPEFNVNDAWTQKPASNVFADAFTGGVQSVEFAVIKDDPSDDNMTVKPTDKLMVFDSDKRYYVIASDEDTLITLPDISDNKMTLKLDNPVNRLIVYELKVTTDVGAKATTYSAVLTGLISNAEAINIALSDIYDKGKLLNNIRYRPSYIFNSNVIGKVFNYSALPIEITSESDMPDYILAGQSPKTRDDLSAFHLMWLSNTTSSTLDIKGFTPTSAHTIESDKGFTITVNNYVDWSDTNKLTLKGGKWIINDMSASTTDSIDVSGGAEGSTIVQKGWENKYLSQLGAPSSIQKNLQTIYDALGNTVQRVQIDGSSAYAFNVDDITEKALSKLSTVITHLLQTQVHGSNNRISQYSVKIGTAGDNGYGKVAIEFSIPAKSGLASSAKSITADVSLNVITHTDDEEGTKENDYYVMYAKADGSNVMFAKSADFDVSDKSSYLAANVYDGIMLKRVKSSAAGAGDLRLFFNNTAAVITTPLFSDDFLEASGPIAAITEQPTSTNINGRIVYNVEGIENIILVDTQNVAGMTVA